MGRQGFLALFTGGSEFQHGTLDILDKRAGANSAALAA